MCKKVMRCLGRGWAGVTWEMGVVHDRLCLGFRHATVSARLVLQLAWLTDGYHSFETGLILV